MRIVFGLLILFQFTSCAWQIEGPEPGTTAPESTAVPRSPVPRVDVPPEKPRVIFIKVAKNVDAGWQISKQVSEWNKAKYVDFRITNTCPVASPCVLISESHIDPKFAGETDFGSDERSMTIKLSRTLPTKEKAPTICHELGHILGLPHLLNPKSCMNDLGYLVRQPVASDIEVVDSFGQWNWYRASEYSGS